MRNMWRARLRLLNLLTQLLWELTNLFVEVRLDPTPKGLVLPGVTE